MVFIVLQNSTTYEKLGTISLKTCIDSNKGLVYMNTSKNSMPSIKYICIQIFMGRLMESKMVVLICAT